MSLTAVLYELYLIDQQVRGLSRGLKAAEALVKGQQTKLDKLNREHVELQDQLRHAQVAATAVEKEATAANDRIEKLRNQMNSAKTNKEYSAMLVEINTLKVDKAKLEEQALEHMERAEKIKDQVEEAKARIAEQEKLVAHALQQRDTRMSEVGDQLAQAKAKRSTAARDVPGEALAIFEKLSESTDGEALSAVCCENPRELEFTCGGCYMSLPIERVNQLATSDKLVRCSSCNRILYLAEDLKASMAKK